MNSSQTPGDYSPLTWWGRVPIYATSLLVVAHCVTMIFFALAPRSLDWIAAASVFETGEVLSGQVWRLFTYAFVHNIVVESWMFLLQMAALYWFGTQVERFLGRRNFLILYAGLLVAAPLFLTFLGFFQIQSILMGSNGLHFAIFISFVAIYPTVEIFFGIQARWIAAAFLALNSLIYASSQAWTPLSVLWLECGVALLILRVLGVSSLQGWPPIEEAVRSIVQTATPRISEKPKKGTADVDTILDKIARQGISSLNAEERRTLEQERETLLEKERQR